MNTGIAVHPFANSMPEMAAGEYDALLADIKANGLRHPITLYKEKIIDGRHRARACVQLKIAASFVEFTGTDAEAKAFVLSANVHRRHLNMKQKRAIIAAELKRDPTQSDRSIAKKAKSTNATVGRVRRKAETNDEINHTDERKEASGNKARVLMGLPGSAGGMENPAGSGVTAARHVR